MKVIDRILVILMGLILFAASVTVICLQLSPEGTSLYAYRLQILDKLNPTAAAFITAAAVVIVTLLGFRLIYIGFAKYKGKEIPTALISNSELGSVAITLNAVATIGKKRCIAFKFVDDCKVTVYNADGGLKMRVQVIPSADVILPESMAILQNELKKTVEGQVGITVKEIVVLVLPQAQKKIKTEF